MECICHELDCKHIDTGIIDHCVCPSVSPRQILKVTSIVFTFYGIGDRPLVSEFLDDNVYMISLKDIGPIS